MTLSREHTPWIVGVIAIGAVLGIAAALSPLYAVAAAFAGIAALVMLLRPSFGVPLIFLSVAFANAGGPVITIGMPVTLSKITVMVALTCWGVHALLTNRQIIRFNKLTWLMLLPIMSTLLSFLTSFQVSSAGIIFLLGCAMLVTMVHYFDTVLEPEMLPNIGWLMSLIFVFTLVVGTFTAAPVTELYGDRAAGVFDNANLWAAMILCTTPMLIGMLRNHSHWTAEAMIWAMMVLLPLNLALTMSRTGFVSYVVMLPVLVILLWKHRAKLILVVVALALITPLFADPLTLFERYSSVFAATADFDGSMRLRRDSVEYGMQLFYRNPILGVGAGQFQRESILASSGLANLDPHNHYVRILAEEGIVGAIANFFFVGSIAWAAVHRLQKRFAPQTRYIALGFVGSLVGLAIFGMGADMMTFAPAWAICGIGLVIYRDEGRSSAPTTSTQTTVREAA